MNPARCERVPDGIETRTSPKPRESAGVDGGLSSRVEIGSKPIRGANGSQAMVTNRLPTPEDSVRFVGDPLRSIGFGDVQKTARVPCKQAHSERYRASPLRLRRRTSSPSAQTLNEVPVALRSRLRRGCSGPSFARCGRRVSNAQGGRVSAAAKSTLAREVYRQHAWLPTERTRIVPELAHPWHPRCYGSTPLCQGG